MDGQTNNVTPPPKAVTVSLQDLKSGSVESGTLEEAFGPSSLGIIIVRGLPEHFSSLRLKLLSYASYLANLSASDLESLTVPQAKYLVGWSHGKETLRPDVYDTLKGSYYVNCAFYQDASLSASPADSFPDFPEYTAPNIWPSETLLPGFRLAFEELCKLIIDTAVLVARACDKYAEAHISDYEAGYVERVVKTSLTTKARLLHYFPPPPEAFTAKKPAEAANESEDDDSWCATHLDHGCLTGLTSALFIDESSTLPPLPGSISASTPLPKLSILASTPNPKAGLFIRSRTGATTKVSIPADCLAFQTGETLEKITRGKFRAVPHFVRSSGGAGDRENRMGRVARNTLAVFTQPNLGEIVDKEMGTTFAEFARGVVGRNTVG